MKPAVVVAVAAALAVAGCGTSSRVERPYRLQQSKACVVAAALEPVRGVHVAAPGETWYLPDPAAVPEAARGAFVLETERTEVVFAFSADAAGARRTERDVEAVLRVQAKRGGRSTGYVAGWVHAARNVTYWGVRDEDDPYARCFA